MLVNNPIYKSFFDLDYKGRENPYMYYKRNEKEIIAYLKKKKGHLLEDKEVVKAFTAKLRWRAPIGMLLGFDLGRILPKLEAGTVTDLSTIEVEYGKKMYTIEDFSRLHPVCDTLEEWTSQCIEPRGTDIRGLSLYDVALERLSFLDIDLSYVTINRSELGKVNFDRCVLDHTEIRRTELVACCFNESCEMDCVRFDDTLIDSDFHCEIHAPYITKLRKKDIRKRLLGYNPRWRGFTEVRGSSFYKMANDPELEHYILKKQSKLNDIHAICENGIKERGIALVKTFM